MVFSTLSSSVIVFASTQDTVGSSVGVLASDVTTLVMLVPTSQYVRNSVLYPSLIIAGLPLFPRPQ